jgi:hypothetical protein
VNLPRANPIDAQRKPNDQQDNSEDREDQADLDVSLAGFEPALRGAIGRANNVIESNSGRQIACSVELVRLALILLGECRRELSEGGNQSPNRQHGVAGSPQVGKLPGVRSHIVEDELARKGVSRLDRTRCDETALQGVQLRCIHLGVLERFARLPFAR